jgi:hypothetical protein
MVTSTSALLAVRRVALPLAFLLFAALGVTLTFRSAQAQSTAAACGAIANILGSAQAPGLDQRLTTVRAERADLQRLLAQTQTELRQLSSSTSSATRVQPGTPEAKVYQNVRGAESASIESRKQDVVWYGAEIEKLNRAEASVQAAVGTLRRAADARRCDAGVGARNVGPGPSSGSGNAPVPSLVGFWTTADGYLIRLERDRNLVAGEVRLLSAQQNVVGLLSGTFVGGMLNLNYSGVRGEPAGTYHLSFSSDGMQLGGRYDPPVAGPSRQAVWQRLR